MARFMVKASEFKNVCKAVNDRQLESLKKEIIEILKKQDEKDVKKAIDYFNSQEEHYTHLEKSLISGKWIQKAGYGVGTVRIWKGKKYKKIAPGKWARVFDKEGRGTNIAIGKLIARVQKIDNVEDLMAFVMQNKQRFVDENGIDLPVLDKLRAAVDAKNTGDMGSKTTSKPAEKKSKVDDYKKQLEDVVKEELVNQKEDIENLYTIKEHGLSGKYAAGLGLTKKDKETSIEDRIQEAAEWLVENPKGNPKSIGKMLARVELAKEFEKDPVWRYGKKEEAEAEKTQNRSEAMKGNQNAKKYGLTDEQIERYDIQEVVEDVNGYGIVKNSEGKYSFIEDGRVKDRPDDFETDINKVKERINDASETKKNIEAAKNYDFANADFGPDVKYTKKNNGKHEYYKKDGSKAISVTIDVSDMREPLNMTYEVSDTKSGKSWQYETAYGNKEGLEWAVERPDQMEKELKKFFKRDPNKEWDKMNVEEPEQNGLGTFTKVDEKTVEMPANKSTKELFDNLNKSRSDDNTRESMTDCYYDGENIVSTDGRRMTIIKAENIGLEPGYVSVKTDSGKIRLESIKKEGLRTSFPNYKGVIPTRNNQEVKINNNALKEKLKAMKKDGKYSKKLPHIALDFEDGKVMLDGVQIGTADNVKFDDSNQRMVINADYLKDALTSGDVSSMFVSDNPNKAMVIKTDVSDSIVMPYTNNTEVDYEKKAGNSERTSFERIDFKSMSDEELKDYEAKLEKELNGMNPRDADFMDKYNYWREVHGENNDRFHQRIEDEARAEKQAEADAKSAKDKEINEKYNGYFENRKGLDKARDLKTLEKKYNFDGKVMSSKEFVEQAMDNGVEIKEREVNKLDYPSRTRWNRMNGYEQDEYEKRIKAAGKKTIYSIDGYEFPKTVVDYAKFYKEKKGNVKKSAFDDFVMDMFIDEDEEIEDAIKTNESLFNDYSAEQPELFNSIEMMVSEAFNRCNCL